MKHGLNTDQDRRQGIGKEEGDEEVEAADGNAGQKTFARDQTRSRPEARIRFASSFHHLTLFFFALFAVLIRVSSVARNLTSPVHRMSLTNDDPNYLAPLGLFEC